MVVETSWWADRGAATGLAFGIASVCDGCALPFLTHVALPKNILAPTNETVIINKWDERLACVTTTARDFEKVCYDLMAQQLAPKGLKALMKGNDWKKQLAAASKVVESAGSGSAASGSKGEGDTAADSTKSTPKLSKLRGLKRRLSDISVPEELLAWGVS